MGVLEAVIVYLILLQIPNFYAFKDEEWKTASATCGACYELRCVDHILWCLQGSPSVILTATDFCPPNYGLSTDYGGWCNFPQEHFEMSETAFACIDSGFYTHISVFG